MKSNRNKRKEKINPIPNSQSIIDGQRRFSNKKPEVKNKKYSFKIFLKCIVKIAYDFFEKNK